MVKEEFLEYLSKEGVSPTINKDTKKIINKISKVVSKMSNSSYIELSGIIEYFIADQAVKKYDDVMNEYQSQLENNPDYSNMSDDEKVQEMIKKLGELAEDMGFGGVGYAEIDPVTGEIYSSNLDYDSPIPKPEDSGIEFIERRPLMVYISNSEFRINKSFMEYLKEILNQGQGGYKYIVPYKESDDDDDDEEELRLTIGTKKNKDGVDNLVITLTGGVNPYESFTIDELVNDSGMMDSDDFKYFKSKIDKSLYGYYLFKLDDNKRYFIGTKMEVNVEL